MKDITVFKNIKISLLHIALLVGIIVCLFLTIPQVFYVGKMSSDISQKRSVLNTLDTGIKNVLILEQELKFLTDAYDNFIKQLPLQKEFPVFLETLSKIAKSNNVKIIAIEPQKAIDDPALFYIRVPVLVDASCGYHALGKFINDLEYSNQFMKIYSIKISGDDDTPEKQQVFLVIHAFCLREGVNASGNL